MATAALPKPPSRAEFQQLMRRMMPGLTVYGPFNDWTQLNVHGRTDLWLPPDLNGAVEPHPQTGAPTVCDGTLTIRDRYPTIMTRAGERVPQKDSSGKVIEGQTAQAIIEYLTHKDHYGQMGLVWLPGVKDADASKGEISDDDVKRLARAVYLEYQRKQDELVVGARAEFKANWEKSPAHKGRPCPPPTERENAATERLQEHKSAKAYGYECDVRDCPGYATNDWEKFRKHMQVAHDKQVKRSMYEGEVEALGASSPAKESADGSIEEASEATRPKRRGRRKAS